ncbi:AraC family transcriptional regulator [Mesorhizobium soli]|uniref:helix-turn-helix domain-containing protein n=1 Tax=Pseudaminobacter soli (ex Li et al. 2025) TaxID=1295366 RepID=UPI00247481EA|nr:AraC family transcriptional regulator [Mesorhizobium soli]MDH6230884.1 AraC family transcriptional regulator [Mesorhizobium soli]
MAVGLPDAPVLSTTRAARGTGMEFLELNCERRNSGVTVPVRENAFLIALQLKKATDFDLFAGGRFIRPEGFEAGETAIFDLRMELATDLRDPFHAINLYVPHKALLAMGDEGDIPRHIQELRHTVGGTARDPVARDLLLSMRTALARPQEVPDLFVDHMALALTIHLASNYGNVAQLPRQWGGGLAPWQERRAKELMDASIDSGLTLETLAQSCSLSKRHFTRAFRQSTGLAPYQWLQHRRIDRAKQLLAQSNISLSAIAFECGFADQSHFTRAFSRVAGVTPKKWRLTKLA